MLPGGFAIAARKTYGHVSDGMICSSRELGIGDDHDGILVLAPALVGDAALGADAVALLDLRDEVLDIAVTPGPGYACRSAASPARRPRRTASPSTTRPTSTRCRSTAPATPAWSTTRPRATASSLRTVDGPGPRRAAPRCGWPRRLLLCGMRPVSLAVDVTNYVMLELGQPLHAFDRGRLQGAVTVRRARPGEKLETLDHVRRDLTPRTSSSPTTAVPSAWPASWAALTTEVDAASTDLVHRGGALRPGRGRADVAPAQAVTSEASKRFERGVDPELPPVATHPCGAAAAPTWAARRTSARPRCCTRRRSAHIELDPARPGRTAGLPISPDEVSRCLVEVGCVVDASSQPWVVTPPSWRPDLAHPADLDEEVIRLVGYDSVPALLPQAPAGPGLPDRQRLRRRVGLALAHAGYVEAPTYPFLGVAELDALGLPADDDRRNALRLANPLSDEEPLLRTTLLPGLLAALRRNVGRGATDVALFEVGPVVRPGTGPPARAAPALRRPAADRRRGGRAAGRAARAAAAGRGGPRRRARAGRLVGPAAAQPPGRTPSRRPGPSPRRPGSRSRCGPTSTRRGTRAAARRCCATAPSSATRASCTRGWSPRFGLPERTCAMELDLELLGERTDPVPAPRLSTYPPATQDVALVVDAARAGRRGRVRAARRRGRAAGVVRLFDVYRGEQVGEGKASLAYALRFRAPDRTLTVEEATAAREAAVAEAARRTGAVLRGA